MIRLYRMDYLNAIKLLVVLTFVHATRAQTATVVASPTAATATKNMSLTCTVTGGPVNAIQWIDDSIDPADTIYSGSNRISGVDKYLNFELTSFSASESVMVIVNAEVEDDGDDGEYRCDISTGTDATIFIVVEVASTRTSTLDSIVIDNVDMYVATCDAAGGKPQENITWILNEVSQTDGDGNTIVDTNPPATAPLSNTKSVFTFPATQENNGQTLVCQVSGHDVPELNGQESRDLDIHTSPSTAGTTVTVDYETQGTGIRVSCSVQNQPVPNMRNYYIFSNGTLLNYSMEGVGTVSVSDPIEGTEYTCMAGNYLGNTTLSEAVSYDPSSSPATEPSTTPNISMTDPPVVPPVDPPEDPSGDGANVAAIAGGVVGAIVVIVIIVIAVCYCKKEERFCFEAGGPKSSGSSKPAGSAVGSSNGSERDVESPLNGVKDVTAEEKTKPEAAPRGHGSIQHTNDNPNQDMYAMVDKKPSGGRGGDAPDRGSGPGQNEPQGMLYADLDLSHKAGHTDKHVPKNENDVVVYSSILV